MTAAIEEALLSRLSDPELLRPAGLVGGEWIEAAPSGRPSRSTIRPPEN
jgi:hypothetical protein